MVINQGDVFWVNLGARREGMAGNGKTVASVLQILNPLDNHLGTEFNTASGCDLNPVRCCGGIVP